MKQKILILSITLMILLSSFLTGYGGERKMRTAYNSDKEILALMLLYKISNLVPKVKARMTDEFISNLSLSYGIPRNRIEILISEENITTSNVYMIAGLANMINKPIDIVIDEYKNNKDKGWGVIAKRLGVEPESKEFKDLKKGFFSMQTKGKVNYKEARS